jgi:hypothetical protein
MNTDGTLSSTIASWLVIVAMVTLAIVLAVTMGDGPDIGRAPDGQVPSAQLP